MATSTTKSSISGNTVLCNTVGGLQNRYGTLFDDQLHHQPRIFPPQYAIRGGPGFAKPLKCGTTTLTNCTVRSNSVTGHGGGPWIGRYGEATLTNCTVKEDWAGNAGGGLFNGLTAASCDDTDQLHRQRQPRR